jgi:hydrogenase maturation protease
MSADRTIPPTARSPDRRIVVIGYGNTLRGDDAVGPLVAAAVDRWRLPGVVARSVHQLTPELAEMLAMVDLALFVDADQTLADQSLCVCPLAPTDLRLGSAHHGDPRVLLSLAQGLYGHGPDAWWVRIPARHFGYGAALSPESWRGAVAALRWIWSIAVTRGSTSDAMSGYP